MSVVEQTEVEIPVVSDEEARRREILLRAAEIIEQEGWEIGPTSMTPDGPFCIMGAVGKAMGAPLRKSFQPDFDWFYSYSHVGELMRSVNDQDPWLWNDNFCRNGERAAQVLREMANGKSFYAASGYRPES